MGMALKLEGRKDDNHAVMRVSFSSLHILVTILMAGAFPRQTPAAPTGKTSSAEPPAAAGPSTPVSATPGNPVSNGNSTASACASSGDTLDVVRIHAEYGDGNFETVVQLLEEFRQKHPQCRAVDSFWVAKYLGVVYAANPATREKGKYWLYKMLEKQPTASLVDLFVGEEVNGNFEKVRTEFITRRNYRGINDLKLAKDVQGGEPGRHDTVVVKDTVMVKNGNWVSPITDVVKDGLSEVKGDIKAGIGYGYVPIKEENKQDSGWTANLNAGAGIKFLDQSAWSDFGFTDETEFRLMFDFRKKPWPINIALDFTFDQAPDVMRVSDSVGNYTQKFFTFEMSVGVRKIVDFKLYNVRPFFGGGFNRITTQEELTGAQINETYRDGKIGVWLNGGVYWELDRHFNIGLETMWSWARIDYFGNGSHGGNHFDMVLGYHF